jgi:hypothetical protein
MVGKSGVPLQAWLNYEYVYKEEVKGQQCEVFPYLYSFHG